MDALARLVLWSSESFDPERVTECACFIGCNEQQYSFSLLLEKRAARAAHLPEGAGAPGFEPGIVDPKSTALPLGHAPMFAAVPSIAADDWLGAWSPFPLASLRPSKNTETSTILYTVSSGAWRVKGNAAFQHPLALHRHRQVWHITARLAKPLLRDHHWWAPRPPAGAG
jgi:hypothetical protein